MASRDSENNIENFAHAADCITAEVDGRDSSNDIQLHNLTESIDSTTQERLDDEGNFIHTSLGLAYSNSWKCNFMCQNCERSIILGQYISGTQATCYSKLS